MVNGLSQVLTSIPGTNLAMWSEGPRLIVRIKGRVTAEFCFMALLTAGIGVAIGTLIPSCGALAMWARVAYVCCYAFLCGMWLLLTRPRDERIEFDTDSLSLRDFRLSSPFRAVFGGDRRIMRERLSGFALVPPARRVAEIDLISLMDRCNPFRKHRLVAETNGGQIAFGLQATDREKELLLELLNGHLAADTRHDMMKR